VNKVFFGDCRDSMRQMAKDGIKVQTCVTSPPYYGLRDYGHDGQIGNEQTPKEFIDNLVEVFACVWDILEDDGTLWVNLGDSYYNYRPGKGQKVVANSIACQKAAEFEHSAKRGNKLDGYKEKDLMGMPWRLAFALQDFGWYLRQDIIWHKPNPMPESVKDRCTKSHEYIFLLSKNPQYYFDYKAIQEQAIYAGDDRSSRGDSRRNSGMNHIAPKKDKRAGEGRIAYEGKRTDGNSSGGQQSFVHIEEMKNKRSVWSITTKPYSGAHFAVYPPDLIEPCILAGSRVGDIVLDPFFGSGTTGQVSQNLGRKWIGCELNKDYEALQNERLSQQGLEL
jgi:DNA modification methylase